MMVSTYRTRLTDLCHRIFNARQALYSLRIRVIQESTPNQYQQRLSAKGTPLIETIFVVTLLRSDTVHRERAVDLPRAPLALTSHESAQRQRRWFVLRITKKQKHTCFVLKSVSHPLLLHLFHLT